MKKLSLIIFSITLFFFHAHAQLTLPDIISDSMVLQQKTEAPIWGWTTAGQKVEVSGSWSNKSVQTIADKDGKWMVKLATPKASNASYDITIKTNNTKVLHGILIGEVWICSGQSNMEMPVQGWPGAPVNNSTQEIANANYPTIHLFIADKTVAFSPQQNVIGKWQTCSPATVAQFSAAGYFFGRELFQRLHVPVGVMDVTWGGTIAEAWTSEASLKTMGDFNKDLDVVDRMATNASAMMIKDSLDNIAWQKALQESDNTYVNAAIDTSWHTMELPTAWENAGYPDLDGVVWFEKTIDIPASWAGKDLKLDLGPIDDNDVTYFNGSFVDSTMGTSAWMADRHYTIPGKLVKAGKNKIVIKVIDTGGNGGLDGTKNQLHVSPSDNDADKIDLSGDWYFKVAAIKPKAAMNTNPNQPSVLYNGMIAPIKPFAIKGAIWYQGESNVGRAKQYETLFPLMINDWRKQWNEPDFPFYFVQIAPYHYGGKDSTASAALRDAQRKTLNVTTNTGMVVTLDIGEQNNIHPADKQDVGKRLSLWALNKNYGEKNIVYSGPLYKGFELRNNKVIVSFTHTDGGLTSNNKPLKDFEVCGADGVWKPANATIDGNNVIVTSNEVAKPVAVRYAFYDYVVGTLFNGKGLPASSFSTVK